MPRILTQAHVNDFRNRLCDVAARLYFDVGHNGFNMRDLASRLGVSAMTPYRYFRDKNEILSAVRARCFTRLAQRLEEAVAAASGKAGVAVVEAYARFALEEPANYRLMFDLAQTGDTLPELAMAEARARAAFAGPLRVKNGDAANLLWTALHGAITLMLAGKLTIEELRRVVERQTRLVLGIEHAFPLELSKSAPPAPEQAAPPPPPMILAAE